MIGERVDRGAILTVLVAGSFKWISQCDKKL
jgi:hypothetical protein